MKAAIIAPTGLLSRYANTGYHLALAHLRSNVRYVEFYKEARANGEFVILDNSVIELGRPVDFGELFRAIETFNPSEVVLCDFPRDPKKTFEWAYTNGPKLKENFPNLKQMVVPQWYGSQTPNNWLESMWHLSELEWVDTIGIPKFLKSMRPAIVMELDIKRPEGKEFHLLGTYDNPIEVKQYKDKTWIRGVDTKAPVRFGQSCIALHPTRGLVAARNAARPLEFDNPDDPMPIITTHNVRTFTDWAERNEDVGEGSLSVMRGVPSSQ